MHGTRQTRCLSGLRKSPATNSAANTSVTDWNKRHGKHQLSGLKDHSKDDWEQILSFHLKRFFLTKTREDRELTDRNLPYGEPLSVIAQNVKASTCPQ